MADTTASMYPSKEMEAAASAPPPAYEQQPPAPYPAAAPQAYAAPPQGYAPVPQQAYPPPPPGYNANQPVPGLPMGVQQQGFNEHDPRWQCLCGMHARQGTILMSVLKLISFALHVCFFVVAFIYNRDKERRLREKMLDDAKREGDPFKYMSPELEAEENDRYVLIAAIVIGIAIAVLFGFVPYALAIYAAVKGDKQWMLWPALVLFGCYSGCALFSCDLFGIIDCIGLYAVWRFKEYLRFKEVHEGRSSELQPNVYYSAQPGTSQGRHLANLYVLQPAAGDAEEREKFKA